MSLSSLVRQKGEFRDRLAAFAKPSINFPQELVVEQSGCDPSLIGTAYDYLVRMKMERLLPEDKVRAGDWTALKAIRNAFKDRGLIPFDDDLWHTYEIGYIMCTELVGARKLFFEYLTGDEEEVSDDLVAAAYSLACCDAYYRSGSPHPLIGEDAPREAIQELTALLNNTPFEKFTCNDICHLNPTFDFAGEAVGGADADLVLDGLLIDLKTSAKRSFRVEDWRQLLAYVLLSRIEANLSEGDYPVQEIGVYFARFGILEIWNLFDVVDPDEFDEFCKWGTRFVLNAGIQNAHTEKSMVDIREVHLINKIAELTGDPKVSWATRNKISS